MNHPVGLTQTPQFGACSKTAKFGNQFAAPAGLPVAEPMAVPQPVLQAAPSLGVPQFGHGGQLDIQA